MDFLKNGNMATGLLIGLGVLALTPLVRPVLRPLAKTVLKAGLVAYDQGRLALSELNEQAGDVIAEARSEMEAEGQNGGDGRRKRPAASAKSSGESEATA